ncbi:MAG TPA: thiol peroxidase [Cyclobacteriaceae bacterium]|nr:thiol peroxidase [Cyclobacteriaceae bacterium]
MANITLGGNPTTTSGELPQAGAAAPDFVLTALDMADVSMSSFSGKNLVLNIFPSVDTSVCAASVRKFNLAAANMIDTVVLCISKDLPFAQKRFCGAEGLNNVVMLSDYRNKGFAKNYGVEIASGAFAGLHARAVVVIDKSGKVVHAELVPEIGQEPDYDKALAAL